MTRTIELAALAARIRGRGRQIALLVILASVVTAGIAFVLPPWYRATASLLPPSEEESGFGLANLLKGIGVPGVKVPTQATPSDVYIAILRSRRVNEEIVRRYDLKARYHKKLMADALRELSRHAGFDMSDAGMITISVEDRDPKRAADMANTYVEILDRFNREVHMTKGRRTRLFVEQRLSQTREQLQAEEQRLADYQSKHKTIPLSPEMASGVDAAARLYAERAALQVRLGVVEGYTRGESEEKTQLRQQLAQVDRRLQEIPETGVEVVRLLRDVKTLEQLFVLLTAQFEQARIDEVRDVSTVEVLDVATPPEKKDRPKRGFLIASAFLASLAVGVAWALSTREGTPDAG